jgi:hypothetical protein
MRFFSRSATDSKLSTTQLNLGEHLLLSKLLKDDENHSHLRALIKDSHNLEALLRLTGFSSDLKALCAKKDDFGLLWLSKWRTFGCLIRSQLKAPSIQPFAVQHNVSPFTLVEGAYYVNEALKVAENESQYLFFLKKALRFESLQAGLLLRHHLQHKVDNATVFSMRQSHLEDMLKISTKLMPKQGAGAYMMHADTLYQLALLHTDDLDKSNAYLQLAETAVRSANQLISIASPETTAQIANCKLYTDETSPTSGLCQTNSQQASTPTELSELYRKLLLDKLATASEERSEEKHEDSSNAYSSANVSI